MVINMMINGINLWGLLVTNIYIYIYTYTYTYKYTYSMLVGGWPTPLKNMKVKWEYSSKYMEKWKMIQT